ncbi:peptidylprolyl isomerase [bacterium]|nr:peptidylprolyl isomerase [bacterium]
MNSLSKLFEILHLSRGEMALRKSHRRRRARRQGSALSCETLEPKQLLAADVAVQFSDIVLDTTDPVTVALEGTFEDTAVSGTVVKFETNAPLTDNDFYVELTSNTPLTNANFLSYVNSGAYDNSKFHRSVSDFVLQGGGFKHPTVSADQPGSDPVAIPTTGTVQNEPGNLNTRGTIAMAKLGGQPDSATSQFFFNLSENSFLDSDNGGYTAFGDVLGSGMTVVDTMGSALTYDAQTYYSNTALSDLPLWNINQDNIVQPQDFVKIENADVVTESALMTYTVTSSDTAKLAASFDSNGDLVLTPVGSATGSVDVTVTAASRLDSSSDSDTFSVQLNSPAGPTITPIESLGSTVLGKDATGKLYADVQAISYGGQHLTETQFATFTPRAVEDFGSNGGKQMLFEKIDGSYSLWSMNSSWAYQSNIIVGAGDTSAINAALVKFGLADPAPTLTAIEAVGNTVLNQDQDGNFYADNSAITFLSNSETVQLNAAIYNPLEVIAVDDFGADGGKQLVFKVGTTAIYV